MTGASIAFIMSLRRAQILSGALSTLGAVYLLFFMEWLFFATKPSFLSTVPLGVSVAAFLVAGLIVALPAVAIAATAAAVSPVLGVLPAAVALTVLALLLFDNFTYTITGFGVVRTQGWQVAAYAAGVVAVFVALALRLGRHDRLRGARSRTAVTTGLVVVVLSAAAALHQLASVEQRASPHGSPGAKHAYNVIFFASDGVEATHTSFYGYERPTTPRLDRYKDQSLWAENAFSNSAKTIGAVTSLLTGKLPTTTKVWRSGAALSGRSSLEHLPGLLKEAGYTTLQLGTEKWVDANSVGMQRAFDRVNSGKALAPGQGVLPLPVVEAFATPLHLLGEVGERLRDRALHLTSLEPMPDHYAAITHQSETPDDDAARIDAAISFLHQARQPAFVHIHLMGTHCCKFKNPQARKIFSGKDGRYDDVIRNADREFGRLMDYLEASGKLETTLVVVSSDHGRKWDPLRRVPLVMLFPDRARTGSIKRNVSLLDVAPTVLDYLDLPAPEWLEGRSLLSMGEGPSPAVFAYNHTDRGQEADEAAARPVKFGLRGLAMLVCHRWYAWSAVTADVSTGVVDGHTAPCDEGSMPTTADADALIEQHLEARGLFE
jgi:hypothetical protein